MLYIRYRYGWGSNSDLDSLFRVTYRLGSQLWTRTYLWFTLGLDRSCPCAWMKHPRILNCQLYLTGSNRQRERANYRQVSKKSKHPTWLRKNSLWTCHPRWNDLTVFMKEACSHMKSMKSCETRAIDSSYLKFHVCPHPRFAGIVCTYIMLYISTCLQRTHPLNMDWYQTVTHVTAVTTLKSDLGSLMSNP